MQQGCGTVARGEQIPKNSKCACGEPLLCWVPHWNRLGDKRLERRDIKKIEKATLRPFLGNRGRQKGQVVLIFKSPEGIMCLLMNYGCPLQGDDVDEHSVEEGERVHSPRNLVCGLKAN